MSVFIAGFARCPHTFAREGVEQGVHDCIAPRLSGVETLWQTVREAAAGSTGTGAPLAGCFHFDVGLGTHE